MISISDVRVYLFNGENSSLKAFASITIDDELVIKGLRVVEGNKGLFIAFPSTYSEKDDEYYDNVFPIKKETRDYITDAVLAEYKDVIEEEKEAKEATPKKSASTSKRTRGKSSRR